MIPTTSLTPIETGFSFWKLFKKYFYFIIVLLIYLPILISSISQAIVQKNPTLPLFQLATAILNSDSDIYNVVTQLQTDPTKLIGVLEPNSGVWLHLVYFFKIGWNVFYRLFGDLWIMFLPFVIIHMIYKFFAKNVQSTAGIYTKSLLFFLLYMFIANCIIFISDLVQGNITFLLPPNTNTFTSYLLIIGRLIPFHGVGSLIVYIINLFRK